MEEERRKVMEEREKGGKQDEKKAIWQDVGTTEARKT